jgi:hypothetical protein
MKKAALLCAVLGAIFFSGCAKEESGTVDTTESTTTAPAGETAVDTATTTTP